MATSEPELSPDVAAANGLRTGWTTGTCASAAAKAATIGLLSGKAPMTVEVALPNEQRVAFETVPSERPNKVAVIKDAGDDPDCTDGAHVTATVDWFDGRADSRGGDAGGPATGGVDDSGVVALLGGEGVGTVTKRGLGLEVAGPAINSVPERMIRAAIAEVTDRPLVCTISVPGGEKMAQKTSNERLGIVGGISILGTTGIVKPFSTASYRASVVQQIDVAAAQGQRQVVLSTGSRSDDWAQRQWPQYDQVCFVEVGDFSGIAFRRAWSHEIPHLLFVGMAGKIAKLAAGVMMTHFHRSKVDTELLRSVAVEAGATQELIAAATETNTARHFAEQCMAAGNVEPLRLLCVRAASNCASHIGFDGVAADVAAADDVMTDSEVDDAVVRPRIGVIMVDFSGATEVCRG